MVTPATGRSFRWPLGGGGGGGGAQSPAVQPPCFKNLVRGTAEPRFSAVRQHAIVHPFRTPVHTAHDACEQIGVSSPARRPPPPAARC